MLGVSNQAHAYACANFYHDPSYLQQSQNHHSISDGTTNLDLHLESTKHFQTGILFYHFSCIISHVHVIQIFYASMLLLRQVHGEKFPPLLHPKNKLTKIDKQFKVEHINISKHFSIYLLKIVPTSLDLPV